MKKNVLIFGLISGVIVTTMMVWMAVLCNNNPEFESNDFIGYTAIVAAFAFIFVGIRNYRNHYLDGYISFGKAFKTGLFISLIAASLYLIAGLLVYYVFMPNYLDSYIAHVLYQTKIKGATAAELTKTTQQMADLKELYKNPVFVVLFTFAEVLPIPLAISLISALILKRKPKNPETVAA